MREISLYAPKLIHEGAVQLRQSLEQRNEYQEEINYTYTETGVPYRVKFFAYTAYKNGCEVSRVFPKHKSTKYIHGMS